MSPSWRLRRRVSKHPSRQGGLSTKGAGRSARPVHTLAVPDASASPRRTAAPIPRPTFWRGRRSTRSARRMSSRPCVTSGAIPSAVSFSSPVCLGVGRISKAVEWALEQSSLSADEKLRTGKITIQVPRLLSPLLGDGSTHTPAGPSAQRAWAKTLRRAGRCLRRHPGDSQPCPSAPRSPASGRLVSCLRDSA